MACGLLFLYSVYAPERAGFIRSGVGCRHAGLPAAISMEGRNLYEGVEPILFRHCNKPVFHAHLLPVGVAKAS